MAIQLTEPFSIAPGEWLAAATPDADDRALLRRVAARDAEALGEFFDRWEAPVHAFVARLIETAEARERVVEAVFWAVWQKTAGVDAPGAERVEGWMHALALGCCRAELAASRADERFRAGVPAV